MKSKFIVDKRENETKKKNLAMDLVKKLGTKVSIDGEKIEVEKNQEKYVMEALMKSGLKFSKAA